MIVKINLSEFNSIKFLPFFGACTVIFCQMLSSNWKNSKNRIKYSFPNFFFLKQLKYLTNEVEIVKIRLECQKMSYFWRNSFDKQQKKRLASFLSDKKPGYFFRNIKNFVKKMARFFFASVWSATILSC